MEVAYSFQTSLLTYEPVQY